MTYYVVPREADPAEVAALREQYADDPSVTVIIDHRTGEAEVAPRVRKHRRPLMRRELPGCPVPGARIEQHLPPVDVSLAEQPLERIAARAREHDLAASTELRWRCHALVLVLLTERFDTQAAAHEMVPRVMDAVEAALPSYPPRSDFAQWLIRLVAKMPLD